MKYTSIEQFRNVNKLVMSKEKYLGITPPKIVFTGTVKIHGTNAGILFDKDGNVIPLKRSGPIPEGSDNYEFAQWVKKHKKELQRYIAIPGETVVVYGEWAGEGIQKGVAISELPKRFYMFDAFIGEGDNRSQLTLDNFDPDIMENLRKIGVYNINDFGIFTVSIDFSDPKDVAEKTNYINDLVQTVEEECPVGKAFGVSGVGEGIVFKPYNIITNSSEFIDSTKETDLYFKAKGQKHSVSKVKKAATVDVEAVKNVTEFLDYAVTPQRVEQAISELSIDIDDPTIDPRKRTGEVIKWVLGDVAKEESDVMEENNIDKKYLGKYGADAVRKIYFEILEKV